MKRNKSNTREVSAQIKSGISIKVSIVTKVFSNLKKCKKICNQKIRKTEKITDKKVQSRNYFSVSIKDFNIEIMYRQVLKSKIVVKSMKKNPPDR